MPVTRSTHEGTIPMSTTKHAEPRRNDGEGRPVGPGPRIAESPGRVVASPTPRLAGPPHVLALQRLAGNRAVDHLISQQADGHHVVVQRDDPPVPTPSEPATDTATDDRTPAQRVDEATFAGFTTWAESATADADSAINDAIAMADGLSSPYANRLNMLIGDLTGITNTLDWGLVALREGRPAPTLTADAVGFAHRMEDRIEVLHDVTEAWQAVMGSAVLTLIGMIAQAQVERARALQRELTDLLRELRDLERIAEGSDLRQAFAQLGVNTAITVAVLAISVANPIAGVAIAVGSAAVQCGLDELLGPSGNDAKDVVAVGLGLGGTATEAAAALPRLASSSTQLKLAGRRLGYVGAAMGTGLDVLETQEAIQAYESARSRIRAVSTRLDRVSSQLAPLRPLLEFPDLAARMIQRIHAQAEILRTNAQVVLRGHAQL